MLGTINSDLKQQQQHMTSKICDIIPKNLVYNTKVDRVVLVIQAMQVPILDVRARNRAVQGSISDPPRSWGDVDYIDLRSHWILRDQPSLMGTSVHCGAST